MVGRAGHLPQTTHMLAGLSPKCCCRGRGYIPADVFFGLRPWTLAACRRCASAGCLCTMRTASGSSSEQWTATGRVRSSRSSASAMRSAAPLGARGVRTARAQNAKDEEEGAAGLRMLTVATWPAFG